MSKYYIDLNHKENGIYDNWDECKRLKDAGGTHFKSFKTKEEAAAFIADTSTVSPSAVTKPAAKSASLKPINKPFPPENAPSKYYEVHSDGGAKGNPGEGGYGYVVIEVDNGNRRIISEGYGSKKNATNNQMELQGAIEGIKCVPDHAKVYFSTDSSYVYMGFACDFEEPRFEKWERNGWKNSSGSVKNLEQVKELYNLGKKHDLECIPRPYEEGKQSYQKIAHEDKKDENGKWSNPYNKICDRLANIGCADAADVKDDTKGIKEGIEHNVELIKDGLVEKVVEDNYLEGGSIHKTGQKAPFYVEDFDENRHGKVVDYTGKEAKVN